MLQKDPNNRLSAVQALDHPWFKVKENLDLHNLQLNFEEMDEIHLDEEPSLANSVNITLITTSPIWNKSKMRDMVKNLN